MKTLFGSKSRTISQFTLVILCILLIVFFMPRERRLEYKFETNAPWEHEQLIAEKGTYYQLYTGAFELS